MEQIKARSWSRIKEIFSEATERPEGERQQFLDSVCDGDADLRHELGRLLSAFERPHGLLSRPLTAALKPVAERAPRFCAGERLLDRFEVVRFLARGGMGEVYEALDVTLREPIAIKVLDADNPLASEAAVIELFRREVRRARRIVSPYVCRVYDIFTDDHPPGAGAMGRATFLTMELLQGQTLSDRFADSAPLPLPLGRRLLTQLAAGLDAAHDAGVLHRDLKPRNIMLCPEADGSDRAVITDFGLAYRPKIGDEAASSLELMAGAGTPAYMAPEQVEGKPLTFSADVYALGIIAFQAVTGRLPFEGDSPQAIATRRLTTPPPSPRLFNSTLPRSWESAILLCLQLDPARRFRRPGDFARAISAGGPHLSRRAWVALAAATICAASGGAYWKSAGTRISRVPVDSTTIAILPFQDVEGRQDRAYFGEGFTEELIASLQRISRLKIVAAESSRQVLRNRLQPAQIIALLGVAKVADGTIERRDGRLKIVVRLYEGAGGATVWTESYQASESDVAALRDRIATGLASALNQPAADGFPESGAAPSLDAHELYWMGRYHFRTRTTDGMKRAISCFERAAALEPGYAAAQSGLADVYNVMAEWNTIAPGMALERAKTAAIKATTLNPKLADGWISLAQATYLYDRDFAAGERCFRRGLEIHPKLVTGHQWYSYMLLKQLRFEESLHHALKAIELDPVSVAANQNLAVLYHYKGDDDSMVRQYRVVLEIEPRHTFAHFMIAETLAKKGLSGEAFRELEYNSAGVRESPLGLRSLGEIDAILGRRAEAEEMARRLIALQPGGGVSSSYVAGIYARLRERDHAFDWLEKAYAEHDGFLSLLQVYPAYESLRGERRYQELVTRLGFRRKTAPDSDSALSSVGASQETQER